MPKASPDLKMGARAMGVVKVAGAVAEASLGAAVAMGSGGVAIPVGGTIVLHSADVAASGVKQVITGKHTPSLTSSGIKTGARAVGASPETAAMIGETGDALLGFAGGVAGARAVSGLPAGRIPTASVASGSATDHARTTIEVQRLTAAASKPVNESGLSAAARALEKHAGRPGDASSPLTGSTAEKNEIAKHFLDGILSNSKTVRTELSRDGIEYRIPNRQGIRYNADGSFSGVLDQKR